MLTQPSTHNLSERFLQLYNNSSLSIPLLLSEDTHYSNDPKSENISETHRYTVDRVRRWHEQTSATVILVLTVSFMLNLFTVSTCGAHHSSPLCVWWILMVHNKRKWGDENKIYVVAR